MITVECLQINSRHLLVNVFIKHFLHHLIYYCSGISDQDSSICRACVVYVYHNNQNTEDNIYVRPIPIFGTNVCHVSGSCFLEIINTNPFKNLLLRIINRILKIVQANGFLCLVFSFVEVGLTLSILFLDTAQKRRIFYRVALYSSNQLS